jgi:hypothetical protein
MQFEILSEISEVETFATGSGTRETRATAESLWAREVAQTLGDRLCSIS